VRERSAMKGGSWEGGMILPYQWFLDLPLIIRSDSAGGVCCYSNHIGCSLLPVNAVIALPVGLFFLVQISSVMLPT